MKKILLLGVLGLSLGLSSCNLEPDNENNFYNYTYTVGNLIVPPMGDPAASISTYTLKYYPYDGKVSVISSNLVYNSSKIIFSTPAMPYTGAAYSTPYAQYAEMTTFSGGMFNEGGLSISNLSGTTSQLIYPLLPTDPTIPSYPLQIGAALMMKYTVNQSETVKTFQLDAIYAGNTSITTQSTGDIYQNSEIRYRVVFSDDLKKADIIFYSAQFAEKMRPITFVLEDLEVVYNRNGYMIQIPEGQTEITPLYYEGGNLTPFPTYKFTRFTFANTSDNMTSAAINYTVASASTNYIGMFNGSCIISPSQQ